MGAYSEWRRMLNKPSRSRRRSSSRRPRGTRRSSHASRGPRNNYADITHPWGKSRSSAFSNFDITNPWGTARRTRERAVRRHGAPSSHSKYADITNPWGKRSPIDITQPYGRKKRVIDITRPYGKVRSIDITRPYGKKRVIDITRPYGKKNVIDITRPYGRRSPYTDITAGSKGSFATGYRDWSRMLGKEKRVQYVTGHADWSQMLGTRPAVDYVSGYRDWMAVLGKGRARVERIRARDLSWKGLLGRDMMPRLGRMEESLYGPPLLPPGRRLGETTEEMLGPSLYGYEDIIGDREVGGPDFTGDWAEEEEEGDRERRLPYPPGHPLYEYEWEGRPELPARPPLPELPPKPKRKRLPFKPGLLIEETRRRRELARREAAMLYGRVAAYPRAIREDIREREAERYARQMLTEAGVPPKELASREGRKLIESRTAQLLKKPVLMIGARMKYREKPERTKERERKQKKLEAAFQEQKRLEEGTIEPVHGTRLWGTIRRKAPVPRIPDQIFLPAAETPSTWLKRLDRAEDELTRIRRKGPEKIKKLRRRKRAASKNKRNKK